MKKHHKRGKHYTKEFKDSILKSLEAPTNDTVTSVCKDTGVFRATYILIIMKKTLIIRL